MVNNTAHSRYDNILGVIPEVVATPDSVASFDDGAENIPVKKLKIDIEPVQEGTGDPSPDNVRPITGWTGVKVTRTGKNLANQLMILDHYSGKATWDSELEAIKFSSYISSGASTVMALLNKSVQITVSYDIRHDGEHTGDGEIVLIKYTDGTTTRSVSANAEPGTWRHVSIISDPDKEVSNVCLGYYYSSVYPSYLKNIQVEIGAEETSYEPYIGNAYDISLPSEAGTVYGGSLEINEDGSGTLTVDRYTVDLKNAGWTARANSMFSTNFPSSKLGGVMCSKYKTSSASRAEGIADKEIWNNSYAYTSRNVVIRDTDCADVNSLKAVLDGAVTVLYMATPQTYTLTAPQVLTLLGSNNIWADTGDISELTYRADVPLTIERLKKAIVSLGGTV